MDGTDKNTARFWKSASDLFGAQLSFGVHPFGSIVVGSAFAASASDGRLCVRLRAPITHHLHALPDYGALEFSQRSEQIDT